jgi:hypothetical protein
MAKQSNCFVDLTMLFCILTSNGQQILSPVTSQTEIQLARHYSAIQTMPLHASLFIITVHMKYFQDLLFVICGEIKNRAGYYKQINLRFLSLCWL